MATTPLWRTGVRRHAGYIPNPEHGRCSGPQYFGEEVVILSIDRFGIIMTRTLIKIVLCIVTSSSLCKSCSPAAPSKSYAVRYEL